jgi:hypothetical protein
LEQGKKDGLPKAQMSEVEKYAGIAIKNLKKFTGIFVIGAPALNRFNGNLAWYQDKSEKAYQFWRASADKAHTFPMKYEGARAYFELGKHLLNENSERIFSLEKACALFEECGLENWVSSVRAEQNQN